jgi:hypothetical protein
MASRTARGWAQLVLQVTLVLAAAALLQVVADRANHRIDLTPTRDLSLSEVATRVLGEVHGPMHITVFYQRGTRGRYAALLQKVTAVAPTVDVELLDLDRYPERARSVGVSDYGRAVVEYQGRRAVTLAFPEAPLIGGVLRVLRGSARHVVATVGHGERMLGGGGADLGRLRAALETENYRLQTVALASEEVPPDTDVVMVAGPRVDLAPPTVDRLVAYLRGGGGVLLLLEPGPLPDLEGALGALGVGLRDDFVVDYERRILATDGLAAVVEFFRSGNPISDAVDRPIDSGVVLPSARSVSVTKNPPPHSDLEVVARTGPTAWAMKDPARARRGETPSVAAGDLKGPVPVMVMGTVDAGRLVVIGDVDLASDAYLDLLGNGQLVMNAIAWLAGEPTLTGERAKNVPEVERPLSPLVVTAEQARLLFLAIVVALPGAVLVGGVLVVWRRRRRA